MPAKNRLSDTVSRDLKKRGFKYLGSVTVYSHLQACGIINDHENTRVSRGMEKGRFDLAGSTIALLFQQGRVRLLPEIAQALKTQEEYQVVQGAAIGKAASAFAPAAQP